MKEKHGKHTNSLTQDKIILIHTQKADKDNTLKRHKTQTFLTKIRNQLKTYAQGCQGHPDFASRARTELRLGLRAFSGEVGCAAGLTRRRVRASGVGRDEPGCQEDTVSLGGGRLGPGSEAGSRGVGDAGCTSWIQ